MHRGRFDPIAIALRQTGKLVAHDSLRRTLPALDRRLVETHHGYRRVQKEMLAEVQRLEARSHQDRGRVEATRGDDHS